MAVFAEALDNIAKKKKITGLNCIEGHESWLLMNYRLIPSLGPGFTESDGAVSEK